MLTIIITEDELKIKDAISRLLKHEGYAMDEGISRDNVIRIVKKDNIRDLAFIKDKIIALEDSLYDQKRGELYKSVLEAIEKPLIEHTLERTEGNQLKAAKILGINRNTMRAKIKKLNISLQACKTIY
ncbi:MAG: hypothetical protein MUF05_00755 [Candidatus Omnitrophica bacterium]|jgi:DNA-binding protein Fis|nr:hypothetical protein [Candidatus Omnitrophota bacterium]